MPVSVRIHTSQTTKNVVTIAPNACVMPRAATLSSAICAIEKPEKRDDSSRNISHTPTTINVPTNLISRRT